MKVMKSIRVFLVLILGIIGIAGSVTAAPFPSTSFEFDQTTWDPSNGIIELGLNTTDLAVSTPTSTVSFGVTYLPSHGVRQLKVNGPDGDARSVSFLGGPFAVTAGSAISWIETYADRGSADEGGVAFFIANGLRHDLFGQVESGVHGFVRKAVNLVFVNNGTLSDFGLGCAGSAFCFSDDVQYGARIFTDALPSGVTGVTSHTFAPTPTTPIPEPASWGLMLLGLACTLLLGKGFPASSRGVPQ